MIATDLRPLSIVEDSGFKEFVKSLDNRYDLPSRKTLSTVTLPQLLEETETTIIKQLSEAAWVAITSDAWTSRTQTPFLAVTVHFIEVGQDKIDLQTKILDCCVLSENSTAETIKFEIDLILEKFDIKKKVVAAVTDRGSNMVKAVKLLDILHVPC